MNGPQHAALSSVETDTTFLTAPGELARLIQAYDWASTPLGPLSTWPQSLKTAVSLMLNSPQPMWIGWGKEATFLYNDAYIAVLSLAKHPSALGRPMQEVWSEIWDYCCPLVEKVFQQGESTIGEGVRLFMNRGDFLEEVYYSFSYSPIRDESGNIAGLFCPNFDATARHLNARRLRTLSDLAARSLLEKNVAAACHSAMQTLADNPDDLPFCMLYLADPSSDTMQCVESCHLYDADLIAPAVIALRGANNGVPASLVEAFHHGKPDVIDIAHLDGLPLGLANQYITQAVLWPLTLSTQEKPIGILLAAVNPARRLDDDYRTFFELTARQVSTAIQNARAAEEEKLRADVLAELDQAKTAFFSNVSHEFRTPLTLMLAPIDDALRDRTEPLPNAQQQRLELVRHNAMRLQKLVNNLLDFSRIQAGRTQASFLPVDLAALTADLASGFRSMVEQAGMRLEIDCPPLSQPIYVDPSMWEKIVLNLLSNAFKFTFDGAIRVRLHADNEHAILLITDTGIGIPAAELPRLFERFHRIEGSRSRTHEGSGIGLALVQDLVGLHGGDITADSIEQKGTTFTIRIPLGFAHLDAQQISHVAASHTRTGLTDAYVTEAEKWIGLSAGLQIEESRPSAASPSHERVLIVDDNADMRNYLQRLLQQHWHVDTAADGMQALEIIGNRTPDLILSDAMMPQLDGFGLLAQLRSDPATSNIPFFMLSARAGEEARVEGLQAGVDDYLVKPFSGPELIVRIASMLLRRRLHAMEQSFTHRLRSILAQAPVAIAITRGQDHVFELANERYTELVGHRDLIGKRFCDAFPELQGHEILDCMDDVYTTCQTRLGDAVQANLQRGNHGALETCFFNFVHQPLLDEHGRIEGVAIVAYEVTELTNARRAAESANRAKDEFLAMLGHELRNPLAPIITALQLMQLRGVTAAEKERGIIERQARHLVALVDDLLDVSRVAQGKIQLRKNPVETSEVIAKAIETASPLLEEKHHTLSIDVPAFGLRVNADAGRLAQVIANLLTNAAKYTEPNGHVQVAARCEEDHVVITISDNGIGISPDMLPVVFDMFIQEQQALHRSRGGLGLGLAIARSMTLLHGGTIDVHSDGTGCGSTFTVRIPLASEQSPPAAQHPPCATPATHADDGLQILIVDDNIDAALLLADMLQMHGHRTTIAHDGTSALKIAETMRADVALLDIGLPGMDGYELAHRLHEQPHHAELHLIAITGYGQQSDRKQAQDAGFSDHMVKPVDVQQLDTLLKACMKKKLV